VCDIGTKSIPHFPPLITKHTISRLPIDMVVAIDTKPLKEDVRKVKEDVRKVMVAVEEMVETVNTQTVLSDKVLVRPTSTTKANSKSAAGASGTASPAVEERDEVFPPIVITASPSTETAKSVLSINSAASKSSSKFAEAAPVDEAPDRDDAKRDKEEPVLAASPSTENEIKSSQSTKSNKSSVKAALEVTDEPTAHSVDVNGEAKSVVSTKSGRSIKSFFSSKLTKKSGAVELPVFAGDELMDDGNKSVASNKSTRSIKSIMSRSFKSARANKLVRSANDSAPVRTIETVTSVDSNKSAFSKKSAMSNDSDIAASPSTDTASKSVQSVSSKSVELAIAMICDSSERLDEESATTSPSDAAARRLLKKYGFGAAMRMYHLSVAKAKLQEKRKVAPSLPSLAEESPVAVTPNEGEVVETTPPTSPFDFTMTKSSSSEAFDDLSAMGLTVESQKSVKRASGQNATTDEKDSVKLIEADLSGEDAMTVETETTEQLMASISHHLWGHSKDLKKAAINAFHPSSKMESVDVATKEENSSSVVGTATEAVAATHPVATEKAYQNNCIERTVCGLFLGIDEAVKEAFHQTDQSVGSTLKDLLVAEGPESMKKEQTTTKEDTTGENADEVEVPKPTDCLDVEE